MPADVTCHSCRYVYPDSALFCANCGAAKVRSEAPDALLGKVLGERFLIQEKLGVGTSGTIYRAEHVTLRRRVAVKVLHHELSRDDLALERFRREATSVGELDNEHIVEIHDFGRTSDGRLYLAMELLEGETLDALLARTPQLPFEQVADILIQVGDALAEAHAIGFIHRDLRPRNVFLSVRRGKANFVKLFDFGLAKLVEPDAQAASTSLGMTFGDPRYMSPEQARGDRIDRRADIYQLGCLAYEMLTGAPPFVGSRVFDVLTKHVSEAPAPLPSRRPGTPLWLEAAVARMLAKQPSDRFATVTRLVEALRLGLSSGEVMDEARAKRADTNPPIAVARAISKAGGVQAEPPPSKESTNPSPLTVSANAAASVSSSMSPVAVGEVNPRQRTMTPRAGVPVSAAVGVASAPVVAAVAPAATYDPEELPTTIAPAVPVGKQTVHGSAPAPGALPPLTLDEPSAVVARPASSTGKLPRPGRLDATDSGAWFEDGERRSAEDDRAAIAEEARQRRERARNLVAPTRTRQSAAGRTASSDAFDDDFLPPRDRRLAYAAIGLLGIGLISAVIYMATRSGPVTPPKAAALAPPDARPIDAPTLAVGSGSGSGSAAGSGSGSGAGGTTPVVASSAGGGSAAKVEMGVGPTVSSGGGPTRVVDTRVTSGGKGSGAGTSTSGGGTTTKPPHDPSGGSGPVDPYGGGGSSGGASGSDAPVDPYGGTSPTETPAAEAARYASAGDRALRSGDAATAAANYRRALEVDDGNLAATIGLGEVAAQQGLSTEAVSHFKRAARLAPGSARVQILLGEAYLNGGDKPAAATAFRKALALDPDNARAQGGLNEATGG